jgi:hypothetical protein
MKDEVLKTEFDSFHWAFKLCCADFDPIIVFWMRR